MEPEPGRELKRSKLSLSMEEFKSKIHDSINSQLKEIGESNDRKGDDNLEDLLSDVGKCKSIILPTFIKWNMV
jgi:hypothetical protein